MNQASKPLLRKYRRPNSSATTAALANHSSALGSIENRPSAHRAPRQRPDDSSPPAAGQAAPAAGDAISTPMLAARKTQASDVSARHARTHVRHKAFGIGCATITSRARASAFICKVPIAAASTKLSLSRMRMPAATPSAWLEAANIITIQTNKKIVSRAYMEVRSRSGNCCRGKTPFTR